MNYIKKVVKSYLLEKTEEMYKDGTQVQQFDIYGFPLKKDGKPVIRTCIPDELKREALMGKAPKKYNSHEYVSIDVCKRKPKEYVPLEFLKEDFDPQQVSSREFNQELYDFIKSNIKVHPREMFDIKFANISFNDYWDSLGATKKFLVGKIINCFEDEIKSQFSEVSEPTLRLTVKKVITDLRKEYGIKENN